jgi:hypothetical protein
LAIQRPLKAGYVTMQPHVTWQIIRGQWLGGDQDEKTRVNNYAHIGHLYGLDWTGLDWTGWMKQIPQQSLFIYLFIRLK